MDKSGVFFRFYGRTAGDLIAFRLLDEYNTNKERKMRMQQKTPDHDNVFKTMKMKHKRLVSFGNDLIVKLRDSGSRSLIVPTLRSFSVKYMTTETVFMVSVV